jgi:hypothetical protein
LHQWYLMLFVGRHLQDRNSMQDPLAVLSFAALPVLAPATPPALIAY